MTSFRKTLCLCAVAMAVSFASAPASASTVSFETWLQNFRAEALRSGVSPRTVDEALTGVQPLQRVIDLDRKQPERKKTFAEYRRGVVSDARIAQGRELMRLHASELARVEQTYGIAPQYIVALWGIETNYGSNTGGFNVVPALATLAWEGRRGDFFRKELMNALKIIDAGHIGADSMKGSWAGAMGQNQFMPSSFLSFAVDHNGDGRRDIWGTKADVFASTANYLRQNGWASSQLWGRPVRLPPTFTEGMIGQDTRKSPAEWSRLGVKTLEGLELPAESQRASVVAPDGLGGQAYLVYDNYRTIMAWNRSTYFATSVGLLADALAAR